MATKMTKVDYFTAIRAIVESVEDSAELVEFIDTQIEQIQAKAVKAKEKAAEKKAASDELTAEIQSLLTAELQSIDGVMAQVEMPEITRAKVSSRLSKLVREGAAVKEMMEEDGSKVMGYRLAE